MASWRTKADSLPVCWELLNLFCNYSKRISISVCNRIKLNENVRSPQQTKIKCNKWVFSQPDNWLPCWQIKKIKNKKNMKVPSSFNKRMKHFFLWTRTEHYFICVQQSILKIYFNSKDSLSEGIFSWSHFKMGIQSK